MHRIVNFTNVVLAPKYSDAGDKYGKYHKSETQYLRLTSFMVPKASPLHVSEIKCLPDVQIWTASK